MYQPRLMAQAALETIGLVADERVDLLQDLGAKVRMAVAEGDSPGARLDVDYADTIWVEYIESACSRGAHAFDEEYLDDLIATGWIVLHYPDTLINERFARLKAEELLGLAFDAGMERAEVWVYLYDPQGRETRVA
jgi:hypothetical protein